MLPIETPPLSWSVLAGALLIFSLRIVDVSLGTFRILSTTRGQRKMAALLGFVEVTIWVLAISQVFSQLNSLWNILAYSGGFAMGTLTGLWLESKIALGTVSVFIVSKCNGTAIADAVRQAGHGATELPAWGQSGPVSLLNVVLPRRQLKELTNLVSALDANTFITVDDNRAVFRGYHIAK